MPPCVEAHRHAGRAGVEAVLEQLLQHRGRPLDHLAGGDLAHQQLGQEADFANRPFALMRPARLRRAAGDAQQLGIGQAEHGVRVAGRRPELARARPGSSRRGFSSRPRGRPAARRRSRSRCGVRTKSASALPTGSLQHARRAAPTSTRFAPEDMTRIALSLACARNTSELAIWPTAQPRKSAAACAVRAAPGSSTISAASPARGERAAHALDARDWSGRRRVDMRGHAGVGSIIQSAHGAPGLGLGPGGASRRAPRRVRRRSTASGSTRCCSRSCSARPGWW